MIIIYEIARATRLFCNFTSTLTSEEDLVRQLRPGVDGLILSDQSHRGTFLPTVWKQLPEPKLFLQRLKSKAGLPGNYWSKNLVVERYTTELIS